MNALQRVLEYYENFERLILKLPKPLQQPLLREIQPIKDLFLRQRPARLALLGDPSVELTRLVQAIFSAPVEGVSTGDEWLTYTSEAGARLQVLDGRGEGIFSDGADPDLWLVLQHSGSGATPDLDRLAAQCAGKKSVIGLLVAGEPVHQVESKRLALHGALRSEPALRERLAGTITVRPELRFVADGSLPEEDDRREGFDRLAALLTRELPQEAKLEMARLSGVRSVQREIALTVVKSISVICGAIGTQPIPFADFPLLTSLQSGMVAAVIYISGQPVRTRLGLEFIAAVGTNVGAGMVLREGSRALLKFLPGWGNAVSGGIAGAGTFALGRAAIAYFIERRSLEEARRLFKKKKGEPLPPGPGV